MKTTRLPNKSAKSAAAFATAQQSGDVRAILETMIPGGAGHMFFGQIVIRRVKGGAWTFWGQNGITQEASIDAMVEMLSAAAG